MRGAGSGQTFITRESVYEGNRIHVTVLARGSDREAQLLAGSARRKEKGERRQGRFGEGLREENTSA